MHESISEFLKPNLINVENIDETLQRDFDKVCDIIGIKKSKLNKSNATKRTLHGSYYSQKSIDLIHEYFADDINMYNYTFTGRNQ